MKINGGEEIEDWPGVYAIVNKTNGRGDVPPQRADGVGAGGGSGGGQQPGGKCKSSGGGCDLL